MVTKLSTGYAQAAGGTDLKKTPSGFFAGILGLEPRLTESESAGLPITPYPTGCPRRGNLDHFNAESPRQPANTIADSNERKGFLKSLSPLFSTK